LLPFSATKSNVASTKSDVASTLLLVWTGLKDPRHTAPARAADKLTTPTPLPITNRLNAAAAV